MDRNIVDYLISNNAKKVIVLDNFSTGYFHNIQEYLMLPSFQLIVGDIRDLKICKTSCEGVDFIFHEAALGSVPRSIEDPINTNKANIDATVDILDAALKSAPNFNMIQLTKNELLRQKQAIQAAAAQPKN